VTPEAVALELNIAGVGSRLLSTIVDLLIQTGILILFGIVASGLHMGDTATLVLFAVVAFATLWLYYLAFEGLWQGRTPGKRTQRLRVVRADGHPASGAQILVRNLLRIIDFLPAYYAIGVISMIATKQSQRLGDLAAGTIVIREPKIAPPSVVQLPPPPPPGTTSGSSLDVGAMTDAHYALVRQFLERRASLSPPAREDLARRIAQTIGAIVPGRQGVLRSDEQYLENVAIAYQARMGGSR